MKDNEYRNVIEEYVLPTLADSYITKTNLSQFTKCVLRDHPDWIFDYAELLECDYPFDMIGFEETETHEKITFEFSYILTLWKNKKQLSRITATANGILLCPIEMPLQWRDLDWDRLPRQQIVEQGKCLVLQIQNILEEYDDTSFL